MEVKKILIPVDGSEQNFKALEVVKNMVEQFQCHVIFLNVIEINSIFTHDMLRILKEQGKKILKKP